MGKVKKKGKSLLFAISGIILIILAFFCIKFFSPKVKAKVIMEAGEEVINVNSFFINKDTEGTYATDLTKLDLTKPGNYEIEIKIGKRIYRSNLEVVDTISPKAKVLPQTIIKGQTILPDEFVTDIVDATDVTVSFKTQPNTNEVGIQEVGIILQDASKNEMEYTTELNILDLKDKIVKEAGSESITVNDFIETTEYKINFKTDVSKINLRHPNIHKIDLLVDDDIVTAELEIKDTTAPVATPVNHETWKGESLEAKSFVTNVIDVNNVAVEFKEQPDFNQPGDQQITILLTDTSGNHSEVIAQVTVKEDTTPPEIQGAKDLLVFIGDKVSFRKNVTVTDNKDENLELKIDNSQVNLKKPGTYPLIYSAQDLSGNKVEKEVEIVVKNREIAPEKLHELADEILEKITNDSMTKKEKAWEIYTWVNNHIDYTGYSDKSDWIKAAYFGIVDGMGDCFTYYAVAQELLTRADIENMCVTRVGGTSQHFWNLINCGNGWYHFDSSPHSVPIESFMLTDKEVAEYTKIRGDNYYTFDKSLYPATPEE